MNETIHTPDESPSKAVVFSMLGKVLLGLLGGLAVADYAVGLADQGRDLRRPGMLVSEPELGWTNSPGFRWKDSSINALGLRAAEIPDDAPADEIRVLGVGASRTFGSGVFDTDDTWGPILEAHLEETVDADFRVLNGGVNGYSALQAARRAIQLAPVLEPDVVLLFIAPGAQMMLDPSTAGSWARVDGGLVPRDIADSVPEALEPAALAMHNALLHSNLYTRYRAESNGRAGRPQHLERFSYTGAEAPPEAERMLGNLWDEVRALVEVCRERDILLRPIVMLEHYQVNEQIWHKWLRYGSSRDVGAPPMDTPRRLGVQQLDAKLRELGCEPWLFVDELEKIGSDLALFTIEDERHWSRAGHRVMAYGLQTRLVADGLCDELVAKRKASPRR